MKAILTIALMVMLLARASRSCGAGESRSPKSPQGCELRCEELDSRDAALPV